MAKDWFYRVNDEEQGPYSGTELKQLAQQGSINATTPIRKGADGKWVRATQVQGLIPTNGASGSKPASQSGGHQTVSADSSNPFDTIASFTDSSAGFSPSSSSLFAAGTKTKTKKSSVPVATALDTEAMTDDVKSNSFPHKYILIGMGSVLLILLIVVGVLLFNSKDNSGPKAVAKSPEKTSAEKTTGGKSAGSETLASKTNTNNTANTTDKKSEKKEPEKKEPETKSAPTIVASAAIVPSESVMADATPDKPYVRTVDLVAAVNKSVAQVKGRMSSGSGFLLENNILITNKHVVESELIEKLQIFFPDAAQEAGPYKAELLYKDRDRDIAILRVVTPLKPAKLAKNYKFLKGDDVIAIGSPGSIADDHLLENAVSKGTMSTKAEVDHKKYYQMDIAVNHGNSGGPVFDYFGQVVGIVTLKGVKQESHGYCIPSEELLETLNKMKHVKKEEVDEIISNHRVKAIYSVASEVSQIYLSVMEIYSIMARTQKGNTKMQSLHSQGLNDGKMKELFKKINKDLLDDIEKYYDEVMNDKSALSENMRDQLKEFWENFKALKENAEKPDGRADQYIKKYTELATKYVTLRPKLAEGLGIEFEH